MGVNFYFLLILFYLTFGHMVQLALVVAEGEKEAGNDYFCGESYRLSFKIYTEQETFSLLES